MMLSADVFSVFVIVATSSLPVHVREVWALQVGDLSRRISGESGHRSCPSRRPTHPTSGAGGLETRTGCPISSIRNLHVYLSI